MHRHQPINPKEKFSNQLGYLRSRSLFFDLSLFYLLFFLVDMTRKTNDKLETIIHILVVP